MTRLFFFCVFMWLLIGVMSQFVYAKEISPELKKSPEFLYKMDVLKKKENRTTVKRDKTITGLDAIKIVLDKSEYATERSFQKIQDYISFGKTLNIMTGNHDKDLKLNKKVRKSEFIAMIVKAQKDFSLGSIKDYSLALSFQDVKDVSQWYVPYLEYALEKNFIVKTPRFRPSFFIRESEAQAVSIKRFEYNNLMPQQNKKIKSMKSEEEEPYDENFFNASIIEVPLRDECTKDSISQYLCYRSEEKEIIALIEGAEMPSDEAIQKLYQNADNQNILFVSFVKVIREAQKEMNDKNRISKVYDWIIQNIIFDIERYKSQIDLQSVGHKWHEALYNGKALNRGFAELFARALSLLGYENELVFGSILLSSSIQHTWNKVKLHDSWFYFDPAWDADSRSDAGSKWVEVLSIGPVDKSLKERKEFMLPKECYTLNHFENGEPYRNLADPGLREFIFAEFKNLIKNCPEKTISHASYAFSETDFSLNLLTLHLNFLLEAWPQTIIRLSRYVSPSQKFFDFFLENTSSFERLSDEIYDAIISNFRIPEQILKIVIRNRSLLNKTKPYYLLFSLWNTEPSLFFEFYSQFPNYKNDLNEAFFESASKMNILRNAMKGLERTLSNDQNAHIYFLIDHELNPTFAEEIRNFVSLTKSEKNLKFINTHFLDISKVSSHFYDGHLLFVLENKNEISRDVRDDQSFYFKVIIANRWYDVDYFDHWEKRALSYLMEECNRQVVTCPILKVPFQEQ